MIRHTKEKKKGGGKKAWKAHPKQSQKKRVRNNGVFYKNPDFFFFLLASAAGVRVLLLNFPIFFFFSPFFKMIILFVGLLIDLLSPVYNLTNFFFVSKRKYLVVIHVWTCGIRGKKTRLYVVRIWYVFCAYVTPIFGTCAIHCLRTTYLIKFN